MAESSQHTDEPLSRAIELARDALADEPAGLLTDFDGTISPIVTDPALARLVTGADGALAALAERLAVVAVITGRTPLDARRMAGVPRILIAGNHGMEWLEPGESEPRTAPGASGVADRLDRGSGTPPGAARGGARAQGRLRIGPLPHARRTPKRRGRPSCGRSATSTTRGFGSTTAG